MTTSIGTTDIILAAALKATGYTLSNITKEDNRGKFHFEAVQKADMRKYDLAQLLVEPVAFNNAVRALTTAARRLA